MADLIEENAISYSTIYGSSETSESDPNAMGKPFKKFKFDFKNINDLGKTFKILDGKLFASGLFDVDRTWVKLDPRTTTSNIGSLLGFELNGDMIAALLKNATGLTDQNTYTWYGDDAANNFIIGSLSTQAGVTQDIYLGGGNDTASNGYISGIIDGGAGDDILNGGAGKDVLRGGTGFDQLNGGADNDTLDGGSGSDAMTGGAGDDIYVVDSAGDHIFENDGAGNDLVKSSISYDLTDSFLEVLDLIGTASINATGNKFNNTLYGNDGSNVLDGGSGVDDMRGGKGSDLYIVDNVGDKVVEVSDGGDDRVMSSVSYTLSSYVEDLFLTGTGNINATGNSQANKIYGNQGNNTLSGGLGNDFLDGGSGNDKFLFKTAPNASSNLDIIFDFNSANDTVVFDNSVFSGFSEGTLSSGAFRVSSLPVAMDADDRILYTASNGFIWYDADGNGSAGPVMVAQVFGSPQLTYQDFLVV